MQQFETTVFILLVTWAAMNAAMRIGSIQKNDGDGYLFTSVGISDRVLNKPQRHSISVHHFAKHVLCHKHSGRVQFYKAFLEEYAGCMTGQFMEKLVNNLCTNKGDVLDMFVSKLFDKNEDGYINEHEKNLYHFWR